MRSIRGALIVGILCGLGFTGSTDLDAQSTSYLMQMDSVVLEPGDPFLVTVEGDWIEPVKGFQLSIGLPAGAPLSNVDISVENTLVGELDPEFVQFNVDVSAGVIVGGVLFEIIIPFDGIVLPPVGFPLAIALISGTVMPDAPQEVVPFEFVDGLGMPPVNNTFVVEFASIPPEFVTNGLLDVRHPPDETEGQFIRGDVNLDGSIDIGDPVFHLNYTFVNGPLPLCLDAGDANDDGFSDLSDAIFLLSFIFTSGPAPWPPFPTPGPDYTPDNIDCQIGL